MAGATSIGGIISGIDIEGIIQKLAEVNQRSITQYQNKQAVLRNQQKAYQDANTRLGALRDSTSKLALASFFNARTASSSNEGVLATAQTGATPGQYELTIGTLAHTHQVATQSYEDVDTTRLGTGSIAITAAGQTTTVTIDDSNNTVSGIRDAINAANSNVRAAIVQDGDASYRLLISSKESGTANAMSVQVAVAGGTDPVFRDLQRAQDATITLGSGADAITMTRGTNAVRDLIPGVTLNLRAAALGETVTVEVAQDNEAIQKGVQDFVDQYNNLLDYFNQQFKFNPDTNRGGVLLGDYTLQGIQADVLSALSDTVPGLTGTLNNLGDLGITTGGDGKLALNVDKFQAQLVEDPDSVTRVFAVTGRTSNSGVQFLGVTSKTATSGAAYAVEITQAARQARVTAGVAQSGTLGADETLTINGESVQLTAGMNRAAIVKAINAHTADTGVLARFTGANGSGTGSYLSLFSAYGSRGEVSVVSSLSNTSVDTTGIGNVAATHANAAGENGAGTGVEGLDVIGTVHGEAMTGTGQILVGNEGNPNTEGLRIKVTSAIPGSLGTVQVFGGIAQMTTRVLDRLTDSVTGPIQTETDSLNTRIADLQRTIDDRTAALQRQSDALRIKFNNMESLMGRLQGQSSFLNAQLGNTSSQRSSG